MEKEKMWERIYGLEKETKQYRLFIESIKDFFERMPMLTEEQESLLQNAYELLK